MRLFRNLMCLLATLLVGTSASLFGMASLGAGPAGAADPQLTSTGSSFAGVAITQWQGQFNELDGGNINFTVSSSVLGLDGFCNQTVNVGATDISYSTNQANCTTNQVPYPFQYMPTVAGGLAFEYNLTAQNGQQVTNLILDASTLEGIFTGSINNWDNAQIAALNPSIRLPDQAITAYYRSDPSGENYLLSDYMLHTDAPGITAFQGLAQDPLPPGQPQATWAAFPSGTPSNLDGLKGVNGADAASQGPAHTSGGIAYVETAYAKNVGLPVASVINTAGVPVQPNSYNVAVALTAAILYSDLTQNLGGVYVNPAPAAYPISAYSYFTAQCVPAQAAAQNFQCDSQGNITMPAAQGQEMASFIEFVACLGQARMADLGYSPIPANLVEDDFQAAGRLPGGTTPAPPTAQNCQNPYITGALTSPGGPQTTGGTNPGGPDVGSSASAAQAAAAAAAAGAAARASSSASANQNVSGPGSTASAAAGGPTAAAATTTTNPLDNSQLAYSRQDALARAAGKGLRGWSPAEVALWCVIFALILLAIPLGVWFRQRRRRPQGA